VRTRKTNEGKAGKGEGRETYKKGRGGKEERWAMKHPGERKGNWDYILHHERKKEGARKQAFCQESEWEKTF